MLIDFLLLVGIVGFVLPFFGGNLYRCGFQKKYAWFHIPENYGFWRYQAKLAVKCKGAGCYGT